jgi:flagellar basal-body rod protein FlgB
MFRQVNLMQRGMDAAWMREEVITNNIVNADTPNYKVQHVAFESLMQAALNGEGGLEGKTTDNKHFKIGGVTDPLKVTPVTLTDMHYTTRMDGSNVNIDQEMAELAENYIRYSAMQTQVTSEFNRLRMVIREGS